MEAITKRNWIFARRNNIVTLAWLTPILAVVFTWLMTIAQDEPAADLLGLGRLAVFSQFAVVMVYFFVNALVSWIAAAYLASRELEDRFLSIIRLSPISARDIYIGHMRTVMVIMLPQLLIFHAGIAVYYISTNPDIFRENEVSVAMFAGVMLMNLLNTFAIATVVLPAIYGNTAFFIVMGAIVSLIAVPNNFMFFYIAENLNVPLFVPPLAVMAFFAIISVLSVMWGNYRWYAEWR